MRLPLIASTLLFLLLSSNPKSSGAQDANSLERRAVRSPSASIAADYSYQKLRTLPPVPRAENQSHSWGLQSSLVLPLAQNLGGSLRLGGGQTYPSTADPFDLESTRELIRFGFNLFLRDPQIGLLGAGYSVDHVEIFRSDFNIHTGSVFGALYTDDPVFGAIDIGASYDYSDVDFAPALHRARGSIARYFGDRLQLHAGVAYFTTKTVVGLGFRQKLDNISGDFGATLQVPGLRRLFCTVEGSIGRTDQESSFGKVSARSYGAFARIQYRFNLNEDDPAGETLKRTLRQR